MKYAKPEDSTIHNAAISLKIEEGDWYNFVMCGDALVFRDKSLGQDKILVYRLETALPREEVLKQCADHQHCEVCGVAADNLEGEQCKLCREWWQQSLQWKYKCVGCGAKYDNKVLHQTVFEAVGCACGSKEFEHLDG